MCLICVDLAKNRLTSLEAVRNLTEMVQGKELDPEQAEHVDEVLTRIQQQELLEKASTM